MTSARLALLLWLGSALVPARADILLGLAGPISGNNAAFGQQMTDGATLAVADLNAHGGVLGQRVTLRVGDDACDPKQAVAVANRLAGEGVVAVIGHYCSGSSIPASKVYAEEGVLQITPASNNNRYTDEGGWNTFRTCGRDDQQGRFTGHTLASEFAEKSIAILHDNSTFGRGIAEASKRVMNAEGKQEALFAAYTPDENDFSALVSRLKEARIEVVYLGGFYAAAGLIARQAHDQGYTPQFLGPAALQTKQLWQVGGKAIEGFRHTFYPEPRDNPAAQDVLRRFAAKQIDPEGFTLYTYAAVQVWAEAAEKAGTASARKVAATLKAAGPWQTVLGPMQFDAKGDPDNVRYVWYEWHDGGYRAR